MTDRFFFYGTLMSGEGRDLRGLRRFAEPVTPALARGDLYAVYSDAFPAMVPGKGVVLGELWRAHSPELVDNVLHITDAIEGYNARTDTGMYLRREVQLLAPDVTAYTYHWNLSLDDLRVIDSGDWRSYRWERAWGEEVAELRSRMVS